MAMRAAIYTRISLDRSGQRAGVDRQERDCRDLCAQRGWGVADVYCDNDVSAYSEADRPEYDRLVGDVAAGMVDVVVAWHQDRLWRSVIEHQLFLDMAAKAGLRAVVTPTAEFDPADADDGFVSTVLAAVAKHQSASTARRMARRQQEKAEKGEHHGGPRAFGHTVTRDALVEEEAELIRYAAERVLAGIPEHRIVLEWQAAGHATSHGKRWSVDALSDLLKQPRIAGLREHKGVIVGEATWPAIITPAQFEQLQALFRSRRRGARRSPTPSLLSGVLRCWRCGSNLTTNRWSAKPRYACRAATSRGCAGVAIDFDHANRTVTELVLARVASPEYAHALAARKGEGDEDGLVADLATRIERYRARLAMLDDEAFEGSEFDPVDLAHLRREGRARLEDAERNMERIRASSPAALLPSPDALTTAWPAMSLDERRAVIFAVVDHVVVDKASKPFNRFNPGRLEPAWRV